MKLGYQFYRHNFIKVAILSCGCIFIFWGWACGEVKMEPAAGVLLLVLMVAGNVGLFVAMKRAKRREEAEKMNAIFATPRPPPTQASLTEELRKRKRWRLVMAWYAIVFGVLLAVFGRSYQFDGLPAAWFGAFLIGIGLLALAGVNVFYGGPLDMRRDKKKDPEGR